MKGGLTVDCGTLRNQSRLALCHGDATHPPAQKFAGEALALDAQPAAHGRDAVHRQALHQGTQSP
jgi:hypothetical protein